jgi:hypothetical protein
VDGVEATVSWSSIAETGGLVASGEGIAAPNPKEGFGGPRLKPRLGRFGRLGVAGGLIADPGADETGATPLLNSAHRGHFRLVSVVELVETSTSEGYEKS